VNLYDFQPGAKPSRPRLTAPFLLYSGPPDNAWDCHQLHLRTCLVLSGANGILKQTMYIGSTTLRFSRRSYLSGSQTANAQAMAGGARG